MHYLCPYPVLIEAKHLNELDGEFILASLRLSLVISTERAVIWDNYAATILPSSQISAGNLANFSMYTML